MIGRSANNFNTLSIQSFTLHYGHEIVDTGLRSVIVPETIFDLSGFSPCPLFVGGRFYGKPR